MQDGTDVAGDAAAVLKAACEVAIAYREQPDDAPHRPRLGYAESLKRFNSPLPQKGMAGGDVIAELADIATPGLHRMTGPRFFGWVLGGSDPVGVAADWLTSAWGQNAGNHQAAPAAAAAEAIAARWLVELLDLPNNSSVGFCTGATVANLVCIAAARGEVLRRVGWDVEAKGLFGAPDIDVVVGDDAHTTIFSALQFLGLGHDRVIRVQTDNQGRIIERHFLAAIAQRARRPLIVILQAGQINTGAFDPMGAIIPVAREAGAWVHIDGAFGLWAKACPTRRHLADGIELADSWATDGHKWLQTPYDSGYAIVRDGEAHRRAMTIAASYLPPTFEGERDPSHYVPELSRRARGFATWAMIRHLGREGIAEMVARHCRIARMLATRLAAEPGIAVLNDVVLNQVILRFGAHLTTEAGDALTGSTIDNIQRDAVLFAGGAKWRDRWVMRMSVISGQTSDRDVAISSAAIIDAYRRAAAAG